MVESTSGVDETDSKLASTAIEVEDPGGKKNKHHACALNRVRLKSKTLEDKQMSRQAVKQKP